MSHSTFVIIHIIIYIYLVSDLIVTDSFDKTRPRIPKPDPFPIGHDRIPLVMQTRRAVRSVLGGPCHLHINTWSQ